MHARNLKGHHGDVEQAEADALARRLYQLGVPLGEIDIKGVEDYAQKRPRIVIIVKRLRPY